MSEQADRDALKLALQNPGKDEVSSQCRRCTECEGEDHHWLYAGNEDADRRPIMNCKHCEATRPVTDEDCAP